MINILVADDEEIIRKNFIKRINRANIVFDQVFEARNGVEAVEIIKKNKVHVVLADINMPFLNGLELIKEINKLCPDVVIIIISGYDNFSYAQEAIKYGVFRYILKPVNPKEFIEIVESAINIAKERFHLQNPTHSPTMTKIKKTMAENFKDSEYSLSTLSREIGLSEGHITKLLKKELGLTFSDLLTEMRIEQAKKIILSEGSLVKMYEVAEAVGYKNQHYFSLVFKKMVGMPPKQFAIHPKN